MSADAGEKTEEPTAKKRSKARQDGQSGKSQDLTAAVLIVVGAILWLTYGVDLVRLFLGFTEKQLSGETMIIENFVLQDFITIAQNAVFTFGKLVLPMFIILMLAAYTFTVLQSGFMYTPKKLLPDIKNINLLSGLKRMLSLSSVMRLVFGIFKICVIVLVAYYCLHSDLEILLILSDVDLEVSATYFLSLFIWTALKIGCALLILAILDYIYQKWKFEKDLKMTVQEVRDEHKQMDGDPKVKAQIRQKQMEMTMQRIQQSMQSANVVVTNPTHLAVALKYDIDTMAEPIVVAKGAGHVADRIRSLADQHGIPIVEKKELARALYRQVEPGQPIPTDLYAAVAEVMAYVYELQGKTASDIKEQSAA